jgi:alcohol dehydrogenase class IV
MALVEWFEFQMPGKVICAEHCTDSIGLEMDKLNGRRVLLITDQGVAEAGLTSAIKEGMESGSAELYGIFDGVPPNSEVKVVQACYEMAQKVGADSLISLGGGSVMDTAKATAILMVEGGELLDKHSSVYFPSGPMPPHIAVPTTAGTGSESTFSAVISDQDQRLKLVFQGPDLTPAAAMLDPVMTRTLPPELTASTGIDALAHCVEAIGSERHQPVSDGLALHAAKLIHLNLPEAVRDGGDMEARTAMLVAANMGGVAVANASAGLVNALSNSCGGRFDLSHGSASAVFLPYAMEFNLRYEEQEIPARYRTIAEALGASIEGDDDLKAAKKGIEIIRGLMEELGMPGRLRELGITEEGLEAVAGDAMVDASMFNNPGECTANDVMELLKIAF